MHIQYLTNNRLSSVTFSQDNIVVFIKISGLGIFKPLDIIFKQCVDTHVLPSVWKKVNIVPIHKKGNKQTLKN